MQGDIEGLDIHRWCLTEEFVDEIFMDCLVYSGSHAHHALLFFVLPMNSNCKKKCEYKTIPLKISISLNFHCFIISQKL